MFKFEYQKTQRYFAQVPNEVMDIAQKELIEFGCTNVSPTHRGIYFSADLHALYTANYCSSLVSRILAPLMSFRCPSEDILYSTAKKVPWDKLFTPNNTFAIFSSVSHSKIHHSKFAALRLKDAIADSFREKFGVRPSIDTRDPDLWINLFVFKDRATISIDTSGGSLHRRGYRIRSGKAPMVETLAAALLKFTEWDGKTPFVDPLCGSGTIPCEAYLYASSTPPGILRNKFGFEQLPDFDRDLWNSVKNERNSKITTVPNDLISGSDISIRIVKNAIYNASKIQADEIINFKQEDIFTSEGIKDSIIVTNPPYGIRLGDDAEMEVFYKNLGDFLKQKCTGSTAYIYFGDRKYLKFIGLRPAWKKPLMNGGLDGSLAKFELY